MTANLIWANLLSNDRTNVQQLRGLVSDLDSVGLSLIDAGLEILDDNIGACAMHLARALDDGLSEQDSEFFDDLLRLLRLIENRGHGLWFIDWFIKNGDNERYAPLYGAFVAFVRGDRFLRDLNPETRGPATHLYDLLSAHRQTGLG
ncbi:hypothetical protein AEAC466_17190 [Asticcacaulis sp. AC466]|nr:hypothetical protein AEAC466_17190 [Asticcacaulis sp. AC466]